MATWPVIVEDWQHDCCGEPFAVGDRVAWTLVVLTDPDTWLPREAQVDFDLAVACRRTPQSAIVATDDGVMAVWNGPVDADGRVRTTAAFLAESHGSVPEIVPAASGTVERIQMIDRRWRNVEGPRWERVPGEFGLRDVDRLGSWIGAGPPAADAWSATGALVQLAV